MGVVIGGPQFREWENPFSEWATLIAICAAVGAVVGFFFLGLLSPGLDSSGIDGGSGTDTWGGHGGSDGGDGD